MSTGNDDWADFGSQDGATSVDASWADFDSFGPPSTTTTTQNDPFTATNGANNTNERQNAENIEAGESIVPVGLLQEQAATTLLSDEKATEAHLERSPSPSSTQESSDPHSLLNASTHDDSSLDVDITSISTPSEPPTSLASTSRIPLIVTKEPSFDDEDEYEESYEDDDDEFFKLKPLDVPIPSGEIQIDLSYQDGPEESPKIETSVYNEHLRAAEMSNTSDAETSSQEDLFASQSGISSSNPVTDAQNVDSHSSSHGSTFADSTTSTLSELATNASDSDHSASPSPDSLEESISRASSSETPVNKDLTSPTDQDDGFAEWSSPTAHQHTSSDDFADFPETSHTQSSHFAEFGATSDNGFNTSDEHISFNDIAPPQHQPPENDSTSDSGDIQHSDYAGEIPTKGSMDHLADTDLESSPIPNNSNESLDQHQGEVVEAKLEGSNDDTELQREMDITSPSPLSVPSQSYPESGKSTDLLDSNDISEDSTHQTPDEVIQEDPDSEEPFPSTVNVSEDITDTEEPSATPSTGIASETEMKSATFEENPELDSSASPDNSEFTELRNDQLSFDKVGEVEELSKFEEESPELPELVLEESPLPQSDWDSGNQDNAEAFDGFTGVDSSSRSNGNEESKDDGFADWADSGTGNNDDFADFGDFGDYDGATGADGFDEFPETSAPAHVVQAPVVQVASPSTVALGTNSSVFNGTSAEVQESVGKTLDFLNSLRLDLNAREEAESPTLTLEELAGESLQVKWEAKDTKRAPKPTFQGTFFETQFLAAIGKQPLPTATPGLTAFVKRTPGRKTSDSSILAFTAAPTISAQDSASLSAALGLTPTIVGLPSINQPVSIPSGTPKSQTMVTGALLSPTTGNSPLGAGSLPSSASMGPIDIPLSPMDLSMFGTPSHQSSSTAETKVIQEDWMSAFMGPAKPKDPSQPTESVSTKVEVATKTPTVGTTAVPLPSVPIHNDTPSQITSTGSAGASLQSQFFRSPSKGDTRQTNSGQNFGPGTSTHASNTPSPSPSPLSTIVHGIPADGPLATPPVLPELINRSNSSSPFAQSASASLTDSQMGTWTPVEFEEGDEIGPAVQDLLKTMPNLTYMHLTSVVVPRR